MFFDTTSIYFEGNGGTELDQHEHNKDHHPDRKQMVVDVVLDGQGRPLRYELWSGNVTGAKTLIPIMACLRLHFRIGSICVAFDRGMISKETIALLQDEQRDVRFILVRLRHVKEFHQTVLARGGTARAYRSATGRRCVGAVQSHVRHV